ncbi:MAG: hypothetical protein AAF604_06105 [Acidobacteriota bacterium]
MSILSLAALGTLPWSLEDGAGEATSAGGIVLGSPAPCTLGAYSIDGVDTEVQDPDSHWLPEQL